MRALYWQNGPLPTGVHCTDIAECAGQLVHTEGVQSSPPLGTAQEALAPRMVQAQLQGPWQGPGEGANWSTGATACRTAALASSAAAQAQSNNHACTRSARSHERATPVGRQHAAECARACASLPFRAAAAQRQLAMAAQLTVHDGTCAVTRCEQHWCGPTAAARIKDTLVCLHVLACLHQSRSMRMVVALLPACLHTSCDAANPGQPSRGHTHPTALQLSKCH